MPSLVEMLIIEASYFSVNSMAKNEYFLHLIIMYQSDINYGIYTS